VSDTRKDFGHILSDYLPLCDMVNVLSDMPSCHSSWSGEFATSREFHNYYLRLFLPADDAGKAIRAVEAVELFFRELNQRSFEESGVPSPLPTPLIEELQRRIRLAIHPSSLAVAKAATTRPASSVSRALIARDVTEAQWRKRYS